MPATRHRTRIAGAVLAALLVVGVLTSELIGARGSSPSQPSPTTSPEGPPFHAATRDPSSEQPSDPSSGVVWNSVLGVRLPVSQRHGPHRLDGGRAAGFSAEPDGAALAAAHLMTRTSPRVGSSVFEPTLDEQVRGPNQPVMRAAVSAAYVAEARGLGVTDGLPLPGADAELVGYKVVEHTPPSSVVDVVLSSTALRIDDQRVLVRVSLQWSDGDWQLIAPPRGDWGAVTTVSTSAPTGMLTFDEVG